MWRQAIEFFAYCQCCGIVHCDIKPANILMVKDENRVGGYVLRVSDFGTSISIPEFKNNHLCNKTRLYPNIVKFMTPLYAAPNVV